MGGRQFTKPVPKKSSGTKIEGPIIVPGAPPQTSMPMVMPKKEHHGLDYALAAFAMLAELLAVIFGIYALSIGAAVLAWFAIREYSKHASWVRKYVLSTAVAILIVLGTFILAKFRNPPPAIATQPAPITPQPKDTDTRQTSQPPQPAPAALPVDPPKPMTQAQAMAIFKKIVEGYEKEHKGKGPTLAWINNQLKEQHQPFTAFRKTALPGPQSSFTCDDCTFEGNGTGITDANPNLKLEIHRGTFKNNGTGIVFTTPDAIKKHNPPSAPK